MFHVSEVYFFITYIMYIIEFILLKYLIIFKWLWTNITGKHSLLFRKHQNRQITCETYHLSNLRELEAREACDVSESEDGTQWLRIWVKQACFEVSCIHTFYQITSAERCFKKKKETELNTTQLSLGFYFLIGLDLAVILCFGLAMVGIHVLYN